MFNELSNPPINITNHSKSSCKITLPLNKRFFNCYVFYEPYCIYLRFLAKSLVNVEAETHNSFALHIWTSESALLTVYCNNLHVNEMNLQFIALTSQGLLDYIFVTKNSIYPLQMQWDSLFTQLMGWSDLSDVPTNLLIG